MSVDSVSSAQREIELAKRLLKEREEDHAREVDKMRQGQDDQVRQLRESQQEAIQRLNEKSTKFHERQREDFTKQMGKVSDQFEKTLSEERRTNYDRTGRIIDDATRQRTIENETRANQIRNLLDANRTTSDTEREQAAGRIKDLNDKYNADREYFARFTDQKLGEMRDANREALAKTTAEARAKIDANTSSSSEFNNREKMGAELRFKRLAEQTKTERDMLKNAGTLREDQLKDDKMLLERKLGADGNRALNQYRERMSENLAKTINDNNVLSAQREQENAARLARQENDHQAKHQQAVNQFRKNEAEMKYANEQLRNRNDLQRELDDRRHKQDTFLNSEAIRRQEEGARESLKNRFSGRLDEVENKHAGRFREYQNEMQQKMAEMELRGSVERNTNEQKKAVEFAAQDSKHNQEKLNINKAFEDKILAAEELRQRQLEDLTKNSQETLREVQKTKDRQIASTNRENQTRLFVETSRFRDQMEEARLTHELNQTALQDSTTRQSKQLAKAYSKSLTRQKESFDDATQELKHNSMITTAKQRGDAEHQSRIQLLDLQAKNRLLVMQMEDKIARLKDEHNAQLDKMQTEHEKATRDTIKRNKELLDNEREARQRDIQMKDQQSDARLKQQEAFFRQEIEKLRRTHELSIKKS